MSDAFVEKRKEHHGTCTLRCRDSVCSSSREDCPVQGASPADSHQPCRKTRQQPESPLTDEDGRVKYLAKCARTMLECVGEDPEREGLRATPERYAKAMLYFTKGYSENIHDLVNGAVFHEDSNGLVIVKDIDIFSLCEHHMLPFTGKMHIGYIPDGRVLGLSKMAHLAEMFSRRLQVQERLTKQVAMAVFDVLKPRGVGVIMESTHLCMVMRGVQKVRSTTTTSYMVGSLQSSPKAREEFVTLLHTRSQGVSHVAEDRSKL